MVINKLRLGDKKIFDKYLALEKHKLSVYSFANIYIWRKFFDIRWALINNSLCVFFQDKIGTFLYLSPLGKDRNPKTTKEVFAILERLNKNPEFAHIENVEEKDLDFYRESGFRCELKAYDYLCKRVDLAGLKGNKFKSKRSSYNHFIKHNDFSRERLLLKDGSACVKLYNLWQRQRQADNSDRIYRELLNDGSVVLKEALDNYKALGLKGVAIKLNKEIKGFTFGFELNPDTFCILYEITDLSIKGLAQFIFRSFSQELEDYEFINIMDDSGLENLKKVKLSYHPQELVPAYIVRKVHFRGDSQLRA
ncbi:MAG: phosphatidylglycerol lysyltransferase domain-containing protein [Candidatus Omnitrophica bacterium]|nr:phosphatidylglycerol lysyltransferase domain-containing protein [Candidatus Omnitrophota bacterium]